MRSPYESEAHGFGSMGLAVLRRSPFLRSLVLTTALGSLLVWLYIVARIVVNGVDVHWPFVDSVPSISISAMGAFAFGLFCLSTFVYLWLWAPFDRRSRERAGSERQEP